MAVGLVVGRFRRRLAFVGSVGRKAMNMSPSHLVGLGLLLEVCTSKPKS